VTRIDHRHNFSPYNTLLYLSSSEMSTSVMHLESAAFLPQLLLSAFVLPLLLSKKDLPSTMLAQTFAFVSFNKVCTSQVSLNSDISKLITDQSSTSSGTWCSFRSICLPHRFWLISTWELQLQRCGYLHRDFGCRMGSSWNSWEIALFCLVSGYPVSYSF
jgi:hypothetical protein